MEEVIVFRDADSGAEFYEARLTKEPKSFGPGADHELKLPRPVRAVLAEDGTGRFLGEPTQVGLLRLDKVEVFFRVPSGTKGSTEVVLEDSPEEPNHLLLVGPGGQEKSFPPHPGVVYLAGRDEASHFWVADDPTVSRTHVAFHFEGGRWLMENRGTNGTYLNKLKLSTTTGLVELPASGRLRVGRSQLSFTIRDLGEVTSYEPEYPYGFVAADPKTTALVSKLEKLSPKGLDFFLWGPPGSGKTELARIIHLLSGRPGREPRTVDIGNTFEHGSMKRSELFGHVKGAFTGADQDKAGLLEQIGDGTLFFDELQNVGPEGQNALLRLLGSRRFSRVGCNERDGELELKAGIICATNEDLEEMVRQGRFRKDLLSRVRRMIRIYVPGLWERPADIVALTNHLLSSSTPPLPRLSTEAEEFLTSFIITRQEDIRTLEFLPSALLEFEREELGRTIPRPVLEHLLATPASSLPAQPVVPTKPPTAQLVSVADPPQSHSPPAGHESPTVVPPSKIEGRGPKLYPKTLVALEALRSNGYNHELIAGSPNAIYLKEITYQRDLRRVKEVCRVNNLLELLQLNNWDADAVASLIDLPTSVIDYAAYDLYKSYGPPSAKLGDG